MFPLKENPILHVLVVGFHHKKGCQNIRTPPLVEGKSESSECPPGWKYLPTLALPDGSHNFIKDTVYFHLPSLVDPKQTVFGISCFRQIPVEKLKNRTADITRGTVQKAVCVLSSVPLYGHIQVKMELVTEAYFMEGDFTKISLLNESYHHLNKCLIQIQELRGAPQLYVGMSARNLILQFRHKTLLLFKLLLLERRVIFYRSPVEPLCATILSLLSLHPGMIENGLFQCACVKTSRPMSPIPQFVETPKTNEIPAQPNNKIEDDTLVTEKTKEPDKIIDSLVENHFNFDIENEAHIVPESEVSVVLSECLDNSFCDLTSDDNEKSNRTSQGMVGLQRDPSMDALGEATAQSNIATIAHVNAENCGTPLNIFSKGYLCLPYLSLPYMDLLMDENVRGYIVGATNVLFKQKKNIAEVLVEVESARVETSDMDLRRLLHLSTEDLRFADFLVRHVAEERHDVFVDGVGWEGGDEWIRAQFRVYLLCLLRTSLLQEGSREIMHFNSAFMNAWKDTNNYKSWLAGAGKDAILEINPGHPFAGQLSVADMKLMLSHTMQNTEGGRKLNQAMVSTGRAVATTGRAVGGALSQAKGAFSSWWSNLTTAQSPTDVTPEIESKESVLEENIENPIIEV